MGVAVTPHHLASDAAIQVMRSGGNAVDAALTAIAVQGTVDPTTCGVGGDLFAIIHRPGEAAPTVLNASGRAGSGATAAAVREAGHDTVPLRSHWSVTVPGCVDGFEALSERYGSRSLGELLAPAIAIAEAGFPAGPELARALGRIQPLIGDQPSAHALYPGGDPPAPDDQLRRADYATTLRAIAADGRDAFYMGAPGQAITAATDGTITSDDLDRRQADWVDPLGCDVFGHTAWTVPPNTQGYLTLAAAWIFEQLGPPRDPESPAFHHAAIEAYRSVAWERDDLVADPDHAPLSMDALVSPGRLSPLLDSISMSQTGTWPTPGFAPGGTAYLCTMDDDGMGVSLIQSNFHGIGSTLSAGTTGVFLHNRGGGFNVEPGHPNEIAPGKRPLHTLSPTLWTKDGNLSMILGTRGGKFQPQLLLQVAASRLWAGLSPADAQNVPRWALPEFGPGSDSILEVEPGIDADGLARLGHRVT
ncbi:MAG: gamma-glutamyltranspeptidase, partial [Acidimicrobiia bacterium]|nr:gamma-glutamyltranspeptidase [Acidimicrobiia bacterium]